VRCGGPQQHDVHSNCRNNMSVTAYNIHKDRQKDLTNKILRRNSVSSDVPINFCLLLTLLSCASIKFYD